MFDPKTPLATLGLALSISGTVAAGYILIERLFGSKLLSIFLLFTPIFLQSQFQHDPAITWFKIRSDRNLYDCWDVSFIYLLLLTIVLILTIGFWVFLVLRIFGVYGIGINWLIFWFVVLFINNMWSAVNQHYIEVKARHKRATVERVKQYMMEAPINTVKRWFFYFFSNWVRTPFTTLKLIIVIILFILLHWPAWLIKAAKVPIDLNDVNTRKYYYTGYMVIFLVSGLLLMFFFD